MKKNRIREPNVLQSADSKLRKNYADNIPVFLLLGLCLLAVSIFSSQHNFFLEDFGQSPADNAGQYVWITGEPEAEEGLYLLTTEQLADTFPELMPLMSSTSSTQDFYSSPAAFQYSFDSPQSVSLPPAIANIFFLPISINRAEQEILSTLPGIGTQLAERIVFRRRDKGPFRSKDELLQITGIGPKKLARLINHITLD